MTWAIAIRATLVSCNGCNSAINEDPNLPTTLREPCPNCGSTGRHFATVNYLAQDSSSFGLSKSLPRTGELLLYVFLTRAERVNVIGDLLEDYHEAIQKFGRRAANRCFYIQVIRSLWPFLRNSLLRFGFVSAALKLFAWTLQAIARILGRWS